MKVYYWKIDRVSLFSMLKPQSNDIVFGLIATQDSQYHDLKLITSRIELNFWVLEKSEFGFLFIIIAQTFSD